MVILMGRSKNVFLLGSGKGGKAWAGWCVSCSVFVLMFYMETTQRF